MTQKFDFHVNGKPVSVSLDNEETPLLNVLRNEFGLMGTRFGCGLEQCGCCMVLIDGQPAKSCAKPVWSVAGKSITTVEGIADGEKLHPVQQKFLEHAALQCGICTPGFLVAGKALLERTPDPSEHEIRYWLAGNLCRCTGYDKIVSAVKDAAATMRKG